ncbi:hypothetical protein [Thioalkalivibrio sp. HK1]|uniref:hypothetical protein n=1 Tax=Thioalkalivibrio sp. HK1 TaxID=1469245 RepID=UPI00047090CA|nr:hypothetical protein [Thioalkalivibrio sp. HK1]
MKLPCSTAGFLDHQIQRRQVPWMFGEQCTPQRDRIAIPGAGDLVDQGLHHEGGMGMFDRPRS